MIYESKIIETEVVLNVAKKMAAACRTAPKACGDDTIITKIITGEDLIKLGEYTSKIGEEKNINFFIRDGKILSNCQCALIVALENKPLGLGNCGYCGFKNCGESFSHGANCALKVTDLGIAIGSAVSIASDNRVDNRVLYSAGYAATKMELFKDTDVRISYVIPLSISGKNVFFDREAVQEK